MYRHSRFLPLPYIHTAYMTKLSLATFSPDRGTCLNTRHMIWISLIHTEINRPDELFGTLLPPHWVGFSSPPKCLSYLDLGLKSLERRKKKVRQKLFDFVFLTRATETLDLLDLIGENLNLSNHSNSSGNFESPKCLPCDNNISVMLPHEICPSTMALSIWAMRQYSEKHSPLVWEHNSE